MDTWKRQARQLASIQFSLHYASHKISCSMKSRGKNINGRPQFLSLLPRLPQGFSVLSSEKIQEPFSYAETCLGRWMTQSCCMQSSLCVQRHAHNPAFWRPHLLCYFLSPVSQMGRVKVCLLHMVLGRELDYGWKYTQMCCHDFCLGLFSFLSKPSLTCSLVFLTQQYCLPDETCISFVKSSVSNRVLWYQFWSGCSLFLGWLLSLPYPLHVPGRPCIQISEALGNPSIIIWYTYSSCQAPALVEFLLEAGINSCN